MDVNDTSLATAVESPFPNATTTTSDFENATDTTTNRTVLETPFYLNFRDEPWVIPLVSLSLLNVVVILIFEAYVLYKSCGSRRHLFLGQILLLGLFSCSVLALFYVPQPHWVFCSVTRGGLGIVYAIVFGALLVKCIFLLKLHDGVYFNASFQALFLFFIVAVEVAIVTQWMVYDPSRVIPPSGAEGGSVCGQTPLQKIEYLSYVMFLLFLVILGSIRARSLRENNREAVYIGVSIAIALVLWVAWISVALIFDRRFEAPAEAFGLVCSSLVVFLLIFLPKAFQLANRNHLYGSTHHSSLIHATPSFLHLQPHAVMPPHNGQGTLVKQQSHVNADYCRGYTSRFWRYDYPNFHQMEPPSMAPSDMNSLKKLNGSFQHTHLY